MPDSRYKRLTWRTRRPTRIALAVPRSTLLLGEDHLLKVESTMFSESYKRFFFRDIQSITIKTNRRRSLWNVVLVSLLALFLLETVLDTSGSNAWTIFMIIMVASSAVLALINNLFGATCEVQIQTAVQTEDLPPLSRVNRANRALEHLRPLINQAQGQLTSEETALRLRELAAPPGSKPDTASPTGPLNF